MKERPVPAAPKKNPPENSHQHSVSPEETMSKGESQRSPTRETQLTL